ncbi:MULTISPECIES: PLP-dependent aminotransferase family protein [Paenibacillus]|uniref:2-aminoadipate transaminase n=1 Tax=Paenibacillus pabuli TaxID=1472 RepID=A0A855YBE0_9BACL|nr:MULTISPECIES: PLP-dependent aminotransferase family protein [Paenibacillus]PWW41002.1 2-aminoadipate transaminase [Paenibacillus pabuli]PXW12126.1 2-aminoadipate transaminase [Paenibacillus taichungensis]
MKYFFASRTNRLLTSPLRDIREMSGRDYFISLAEELPAEELFPFKLLEEAAVSVFSSGPSALQYGEPAGYRPLREWLDNDWNARKGIRTVPEQILLTTGTQQAIDLVMRLLLEPGDSVLVEHPTSPGCLEVLEMQGAKIVPVTGDGDGILPDLLEHHMQQVRPKLLFAAPSFSNPTGVLWSMERREAVLDLCSRYGVLLVEDDSYGELHFDGLEPGDFYRKYPSLFALDTADQGGHVLYIGSFSKTVAPALRTGWAAGHPALIQAMASVKRIADGQSSPMNQRLLYQLLAHSPFKWSDHLSMLNREYKTRLKLMLELLKRPGWKGSQYNIPEGGMYLWVQLPDGLDSGALLKAALLKGVSFLPGSLCSTGEQDYRYIRLNFSHPGRDELLLGMNLISESITEFTARS